MRNNPNNITEKMIIVIGVGVLVLAFMGTLADRWGFDGVSALIMYGEIFATIGLLVYRQYPATSWLLALCVGFMLLFSLTLYRGYALKEPEKVAEDEDEISEAELEDLMDEYIALTSNALYLDADSVNPLLYYDDDYGSLPETYVTIYFPAVETLEGLWDFVEGSVEVSGAVNGTFYPEIWNDGGGTFEPNKDSDLWEAIPQINIYLPLRDDDVGQTIHLDARIKIRYPTLSDDGQEVVQVEKALQGEVRTEIKDYDTTVEAYSQMFNAYDSSSNQTSSAAHKEYQVVYGRWKKAQAAVNDSPGWLLLVAGNVLMVALMVGLAWKGGILEIPVVASSSQDYPVAGLELHGLKKMGIEVSSLSEAQLLGHKVDISGVYVEWVETFSPAGRGGIIAGDVIVEMDGRPVKTRDQVRWTAAKMKRGSVMPVVVRRGKARVELIIKF